VDRAEYLKDLGRLVDSCDDMRGVLANLIYSAEANREENTAKSLISQLMVHQANPVAERQAQLHKMKGTEFAETIESEDDAFWRNDHARTENDY